MDVGPLLWLEILWGPALASEICKALQGSHLSFVAVVPLLVQQFKHDEAILPKTHVIEHHRQANIKACQQVGDEVFGCQYEAQRTSHTVDIT